jgi:hypothetical protein
MARWLRAALVLFGLGATLGVALDGIHTHLGATSYTRPVFWLMAWWVPPLFGGAFTIGLARPLLERLLGVRSPTPPRGVVLAGLAGFTGAYFLTVAPLPWPAIAALLLAVFAALWWSLDRTAVGLGISVAAAFGGPAVEHMLVEQGLFVHHQVLAFGVPGWLPFLYMVAGVALTVLAKHLVEA